MRYVFDSSTLITLFQHYYRDRFPTLWQRFDLLVKDKDIISVGEVFNEIGSNNNALGQWAKGEKRIFVSPSDQELRFVVEIFRVRHFQQIIGERERLMGKPVADPFLIARAKFLEKGCVVTEEKNTPHAAKIPNVCEHFGVKCTNLEGFMDMENWNF